MNSLNTPVEPPRRVCRSEVRAPIMPTVVRPVAKKFQSGTSNLRRRIEHS